MKKIIVKSTKLTEATSVNYQGDDKTVKKINSRVNQALRTAEAARAAAKKARQDGNEDIATELENRAAEIEVWADIDNNKYRTDDQDEPIESSDEDSESENESESDEEAEDGDSKSDTKSENEDESETDNESEESEDESDDDSKGGRRSDDSDDDSDSDSEDSDASTTFENPFDIDPKHSQQTSSNDNQPKQPPKPKSEFELIKKALRQLRGGEKDGAKKAFGEILAKLGKTESLVEAFNLDKINKDITDMTDDEFNDVINATLDAINQVKPVTISTDIEARIKKIEKDNSNVLLNQELDDEDREHTAEERAKFRRGQQEIAKYRAKSSGTGESDFKQMLRLAIATQVAQKEREDDSWSDINRRHQDDDIIAPGKRIDNYKKKDAITLKVYLDCSGSFDTSDIEKERAWLAVIDKFVQKKQVYIEPIVYFANHIHSTYSAARNEGGTSAWREMVDDMQATKPDNVLIVTDSDMEYQAKYYDQTYTARGCVWYVWKDSDAPNMLNKVKGMRGTSEFWMN